MRLAYLLTGAAALLSCLLLGCGTMGLTHKDAAAQPGIATSQPPGGHTAGALDFRQLHLPAEPSPDGAAARHSSSVAYTDTADPGTPVAMSTNVQAGLNQATFFSSPGQSSWAYY